MIFIPITLTNHLTLNAKCYRDTKPFLIAWLSMKAEKQGCYIYFDKEGNVLYVGKSNNLESRLLHHATPQGIEKDIPDWFCLGIVFSNNPLLTERELVRSLQPVKNKLLK